MMMMIMKMRLNVLESPCAQLWILFALTQDGKVFMFTGMLEAVADVHQLTIILGHEMAHALLGHGVRTKLSRIGSSKGL